MKWGIKYSKWYKGEWDFHDEDDTNREQINRFREIRKLIVDPLIKFKTNLMGTNSAREITKRLYEFLIENKIDDEINGYVAAIELVKIFLFDTSFISVSFIINGNTDL